VFDTGAQVRLTVGIIMNPDSSIKTMWAPSRAAFFYPRPCCNVTTMKVYSATLPDKTRRAPRRPQFGTEVRCRHTVEVDPALLKGLRGPRLYRALRCSRCGAREADVSIRWELGPSFATLGKH
jgi:hypothetical protein